MYTHFFLLSILITLIVRQTHVLLLAVAISLKKLQYFVKFDKLLVHAHLAMHDEGSDIENIA